MLPPGTSMAADKKLSAGNLQSPGDVFVHPLTFVQDATEKHRGLVRYNDTDVGPFLVAGGKKCMTGNAALRIPSCEQ